MATSATTFKTKAECEAAIETHNRPCAFAIWLGPNVAPVYRVKTGWYAFGPGLNSRPLSFTLGG